MLHSMAVPQSQSIPALDPVEPSKAELIISALNDTQNFISDLGEFLVATAHLFRQGDGVTANSSFVGMITGLGWLLKAVDTIGSALNINFATYRFDNISLMSVVQELNELLDEMVRAQEKNDWVLLADLLEYELSVQLERWKRIFSALGQGLQ